MAFLVNCCCGPSAFGEELFKDWDNHPAAQQYTFIKRLGEGGFSEVQLAKDNLTGKTVALKIVFLNKAGLKPDERRILAGEVKLLRMVAHPNIVRCMRVLETRRQQVLVLEHLSGGEMLQQLQRVKRYTEAHASQLFRQVVDAVAYLHSLGIMHRDIKPENCLLAKPAQHYKAKNKPVKVKLIDLGMAGLYRPRKPLFGCMGSPGFIAPEVVLGEAHTPAMDIYSLGVLLFIMLVGRKPWDSQRSHTLQYAVEATADAPGLADAVFKALSPAAQQLILVMLSEEPGDRPSASDVLNHAWMKVRADGSPAAASERLIQPAVQQRLRMLGNSRQIMGTARGMMLLHSRGSKAGAVAFHKAVKEARAKLQQQAAALKAAGQLPEAGQDTAAADGCEVEMASTTANHRAAAARPASSAAAERTIAAGASTAASAGGKGLVGNAPDLARPVSYSDPLSAAAQAAAKASDFAAADNPLVARRRSALGDLARVSLQQQILLFKGPQRPPAVQPAAPAAISQLKVASGPSASEERTAGTAVGVGGLQGAPDAALLDALERGMSVPNPDLAVPFSVTNDALAKRYERAVSLSPGAFALLDADDRMCLLAASADDDDDGAALFSWANRRGAADMIQSFKERYPAKPIARSLAKFGQSLSRSLRHSIGGLGTSYHGGMFSPRGGAGAVRLGSGSMPESPTAPGDRASFIRPSATRLLSISSAGEAGDPSGADQSLLEDSTAPKQRRSSNEDSAAGAGAVRRVTAGRSSSVRFADEVLLEDSSRRSSEQGAEQQQQRQQQQQPEPDSAVKTASPQVPIAAASNGTAVGNKPAGSTPPGGPSTSAAGTATKAAAVRANSAAAASLELAFLGTQLSLSPPTSPPNPAATPRKRPSAETDPLSPEPDTPANRRIPPGKAAAAAANRHFKQLQVQQRQHGQQVGLPAVQVMPAIPSDVSDAASGDGSAHGAAHPANDTERTADSAVTNQSWQQSLPQLQQGRRKRPKPIEDPGIQAAANVAATAATASAATAAAALIAGTPLQSSSSDNARQQRSASGSNSRGSNSFAALASRNILNSPSMRAAAAAAAAQDEEEGLNLPNGLWLMQSSTLSEAGILTPRGGLGTGLGLELTALRTLSSAVASPRGLVPQDSMLNVAFAEPQMSETSEEGHALVAAAVGDNPDAASSGRAVQEASSRSSPDNSDTLDEQQEQAQQQEESEHAQYSRRTASQRHTRDLSVMDWLDPEDALLAGQTAAGQTAAQDRKDISIGEWMGTEAERQALAAIADSTESLTAAAGGRVTVPDAKAVDRPPSRSRHVAVPHSLAGSSRHGHIKHKRWSSSLKHGRRKRTVSSDGGTTAAAAADASIDPEVPLEGSSAAAGTDLGDSVTGAAEQGLGQSVGAEGHEQDFYVGSFNDEQGLAGKQPIGFDDRLGSDGLNPDEIEDLVVHELGPAATAQSGTANTAAGIAGSLALMSSMPAHNKPRAAGSATAMASGTDGRVSDARASESGQDDDPALLVGLEESTSIEQPIASSENSTAQLSRDRGSYLPNSKYVAVQPVVSAAESSKQRGQPQKSGGTLAGPVAATVGRSIPGNARHPGKLATALEGSIPVLTKQQQAAQSAVTPGSSTGWPGGSSKPIDGGVAWLVKSLSGKYRLPDGDHTSIAEGDEQGPNRSRARSRHARAASSEQPVYDDFDEPTAWYYAS